MKKYNLVCLKIIVYGGINNVKNLLDVNKDQ
ncbi:hypothetical protein DFR57_101243 [Saliterribacillus persicus]|uniref:Uncharacterized protein n=1 Tax=Saliterribacillus persicus TaxID=930114 RepID=A0A368YAT2_9BACI|nr:hypothetical protein DFR57_101243 [Saliterribacillus persicus]